MKEKKQKKMLTLRIAPDLHKDLKIAAVSNGRSIQQILTELIEKFLNK